MHRSSIFGVLVIANVVSAITGDNDYSKNNNPVEALSGPIRRSYCQGFHQWQCHDGTCIPSDSKCDGVVDCSDKSDETHAVCRNNRCQSNWFRCTYGACVASSAACDGKKDCADNSDELLPKCRNEIVQYSRYFKCDDGEKIPTTAQCDGVKDCRFGSDESLEACGRNECPPYYFQCAYGACVDRGADCNGIIECADGSDEDDILCNKTQTITSTITQPDTSKGCVLPPYPTHGSYETAGIPTAPGNSIADGEINFTCNQGYRLIGESKVLCFNGKWQSEFPKCGHFCKLINKPNVEYRCVLNGDSEGSRKCNDYEPEGTQVKHKCAPNYRSEDEDIGYMVCRSDGWVNVPRCLPDCGTVTPNGVAMIITGRQAKRGELPWHVGIYSKHNTSKNITRYKQICGGSLISATVVLSAAHCFWGDQVPMPAERYAVGAGKLYRNWRDLRDDEAQFSDVKELYIPPLFMGPRNEYQEDIAVLVLAQPIQFRPHIRPVCMNFDHDFARDQLHPGNLGKVAGWGLTDVNGKPPAELKVVDLPFVDPGVCKDQSPEEFKPMITADKFCAGYKNGTALCIGDSGGGLAFKKSGTERYYLRGIVSTAHMTSDKCDSVSYTTFTNIMTQEDFIKQHWDINDL